jgi:hypothetical protein
MTGPLFGMFLSPRTVISLKKRFRMNFMNILMKLYMLKKGAGGSYEILL